MKRFYLEICNACNLDCPFCSYSKGNEYMSYGQIRDYVEQIKAYCDYIYLHMLGEPLLHPDFKKILQLLDEMEMKLQLVSNGTLLHKYPDLLEHRCLRKLAISIHSVNELDLSPSYFETIDRLIGKNEKTIIELRFYDLNDLSADIRNYLNILLERYSAAFNGEKMLKLKDGLYLSFQDFFSWPKITDPFISDQGTCHGGTDILAINVKGEVTLCCLDPEAQNSLGNLHEKSLKEIIEAEEYRKITADLRNHKLDKELCKRCTYRLRFR